MFLISKLAVAVLVLSLPLVGANPSPPPIQQTVHMYPPSIQGVANFIRDVTPWATPNDATRLSKLIVKSAAKWGIDPRTLAAVVRHESGFKRDALACRNEADCDHGLGQINSVHISDLKLDPKKLMDPAYNLNIAARLLARAQLYEGVENAWWSRYHDVRPGPRLRYERVVSPYMRKAFSTYKA